MAELGFKSILISLLITGLFAIAIITAGIMIGEQNDYSSSIANDPSLVEYSDSVRSTLNNATSSTESATSVLSNSTITTTTSTPFVDSISGIWKTVKSAPVAIWNLTMGMVLERTLGENKTIVLSILAAILGIMILFAIIYLIATGDGR